MKWLGILGHQNYRTTPLLVVTVLLLIWVASTTGINASVLLVCSLRALVHIRGRDPRN